MSNLLELQQSFEELNWKFKNQRIELNIAWTRFSPKGILNLKYLFLMLPFPFELETSGLHFMSLQHQLF